MFLRANTDDLEVVTGSAADIEVHISAMQVDGGTPPVVQPLPNLGPLASITTATTTQVVDTSGITSGHNVAIRYMSLFNNHASQSCVTTVQVNDGTNTTIKAKATLLAGESLHYLSNGRWVHLDANCAEYPSVGNAASQAEMEAGTATDMYVSPGRLHFHPGVAKFVCMTTGGATPTMQTPPSYNVTSITDSGAGRLTVTIATDFSSATWACLVDCTYSSTTITNASVFAVAHVRSASMAAGSVEVNAHNWVTITSTLVDPTAWHVAGFGDQA
jgi:hypothetical protein